MTEAARTPRDVELAAVVDKDELVERADRWTVLAGRLAQIHENLDPRSAQLPDVWAGAAAESFVERLGALLGGISRLADDMLLVKQALMRVHDDTTPVRQALYRDVIGWQRDLADIALEERSDPLGGGRFDALRADVTGRWLARADADADPLVDVLAAGAAALADIESARPALRDPGRPPAEGP